MQIAVAWRGVVWRGVAWRGVAWRGVAWRGVGCGVACSGSDLPASAWQLKTVTGSSPNFR